MNLSLLFNKLKALIQIHSTAYLSFWLTIPILMGLALGGRIKTVYLLIPSTDFTLIDIVLVPFAFFLWGFVGLIWIMRKEAPQFTTLKGKPAILLGTFVTVFSWGMALYALYQGFSWFLIYLYGN